MDTMARVVELADEQNLSLFKLAQLADVPYSTLRNAQNAVPNLLSVQLNGSARPSE